MEGKIMKVKLEELAAALLKSDRLQGYIDLTRGKTVLLDSDMDESAREEHVFEIEEDWEHYIPLPNAVDEHEREIMRSFAALQEEELRSRLELALKGAGGASRFRREVRHLLLKKSWEEHQLREMLKIARDFCEENAIEYEA